jgi:hypothetical protein
MQQAAQLWQRAQQEYPLRIRTSLSRHMGCCLLLSDARPQPHPTPGVCAVVLIQTRVPACLPVQPCHGRALSMACMDTASCQEVGHGTWHQQHVAAPPWLAPYPTCGASARWALQQGQPRGQQQRQRRQRRQRHQRLQLQGGWQRSLTSQSSSRGGSSSSSSSMRRPLARRSANSKTWTSRGAPQSAACTLSTLEMWPMARSRHKCSRWQKESRHSKPSQGLAQLLPGTAAAPQPGLEFAVVHPVPEAF